MLNTISWQEFLTAIALIAAGYYIIGTLLLYRVEIANIFNRRVSKSISPEITKDQNEPNENNDLLGGIKYESETKVPHEKIVESDAIIVAQPNELEEPIVVRDPLADSFKQLRNEIELLAEGLTPEHRETLLLFDTLLSRYPQLLQTPYEEEVAQFISKLIHEKLSTHLEPSSIKKSWAETVVSESNHH